MKWLLTLLIVLCLILLINLDIENKKLITSHNDCADQMEEVVNDYNEIVDYYSNLTFFRMPGKNSTITTIIYKDVVYEYYCVVGTDECSTRYMTTGEIW